MTEIPLEKVVRDLETRVGYASMCAYYHSLDSYVKAHINNDKYTGDSFKLIQLGHLVEIMKRAYAKIHSQSP